MDHNSTSINEEAEVVGKEEAESVEKLFEAKGVPPWQKQLTFRAFLVSFVLSILFTFIVMKLSLTTGIIPSLNVSAGLLGFFFVKIWTRFLEKPGLLKQPFTRQENTVIQTCVVASSGIAFSGGFGSYLFGMSEAIAKTSTEANDSQNIKNPTLTWMIGFLFVVSFLGLFSVVPLRKIMIIDFRLMYPSGTATGHLINGFHTPRGARLAKKKVRTLGKFFSFSFLWGFFQWFFTAGDGCGFADFPTFGLKAYQNKFFFDFSATYVGVGMICPYLINISLLVGAILSWGIMWPLIEKRKGDWYSATLAPSSLHGIQGYRVFIAIAMILGDGLYNFVKVLGRTLLGLYQQIRDKNTGLDLPVGSNLSPSNTPTLSYDDERRTRLFLKDKIPTWVAISVYIVLATISAATLPHIFHPLKWSMFLSQVLGTAIGCIISPCVFWIFYKAFPDLGIIGTQYPAPNATLFRGMAILGVEGFSSMPKHCLTLCYVFFIAAAVINGLRDIVRPKWARFIPIPMAMAIPFYLGANFTIAMCVGSLVLFIWEIVDKANADAFGSAVASGLICGDGIWTLPNSVLALAGVKPPICMKFLSRKTNARVDKFLGD